MDKEEGEMSDDAMLIDDDKDCIPEEVKPTLLYKAEKEGLVITKLEKIDAAKIEERARRFGLNLTGNRVVTQKQIDELYCNFGIESGNERHFRFDTLHINGVDGLSTKEIFEYLEDYKPVSLEWIDDVSCNIVCQDHISAALALLVHSREIKNEELKDMIDEKSSNHWREGIPHPKKDLILLRFATNGDKKMPKKKTLKEAQGFYDESMEPPTKNPWGDLCKSWGVYDHQEVFNHRLHKNDYEDEIEEPNKRVQIKSKRLAMRLGKRPHTEDDKNEESNSDSEWKKKSKTPRMRMHADDEESKQNKKKQATLLTSKVIDKEVYAPLSIEVINSRSTYTPRETAKLSDKFRFHDQQVSGRRGARNNIQARLGAKVMPSDDQSSSDTYSSDESDHNTMSRVQKMSTTKGSSVWSRLESKPTNSNDHSDLRQMLKSKKKPSKPDDLRERIRKSKKTALRIEIDNI